MDLYETLGVPRDADAKAIKKAFRKRARETHPDHGGDENAFKRVNLANEVLSDPEKRALYDQYGAASLQPGFDPAWAAGAGYSQGFSGQEVPFDMEDLLSSLFGGGGGFGRGGFRAGGFGGSGFGGAGFDPSGFAQGAPPPMQATLSLDFRTAALGGVRSLQVDGRKLDVRIPPGVRDGGTLRLRGKAPNGGDLELSLRVEPDPVFARKGDDLEVHTKVTLKQLMLGDKIQVPTLDGSVRVTIPEGSQPGARLRIRGKGIARKGRAGDLYVELDLVLPTRITPEIRAAVETIDRASASRAA